ncbi:PAS domain-containing sensor histidine kinase [Marinobacterium zhoushanense]|uniref:histidine kinase n=1 Tax=Marinobacterium zhoushanense TaxID=1679163 RepID=A0ABQ1KR38_9GAMM|nr:ATP-binding protein [Marinobacterium zhoushanense]GGC07501.1 PAS domain-containing sensor histidine kinase [Marinobacterium zhoushanense]
MSDTARIAELERELEQLRSERDAAQRLRRLIDQMPSGVLVIDNKGEIAECNPAAQALLGVELFGKRWVDVIAACFAPRPDDGHEVSLKNGKRVSLATRALEGEPGQLVFVSDQTDTRLLQHKLSHYQRLSEMGRMMASLAHQVRTPLSAALLYASHLAAPELTDEQRIRFAGKVKSRLTHLEQQVRDMLIFARGETKLDNRVTASQLVARIDDLLDMPLANANADCSFVNNAPELTIQCNLEALLGAILNLVTNALQACGQGAELQIKLSQQSPWLRLDVIDKGPGMAPEQIKRALEPFYTTKSHGTGLGLAVAQVVARAHHGEFRLTSVPSVGTCATFLLPSVENDG